MASIKIYFENKETLTIEYNTKEQRDEAYEKIGNLFLDIPNRIRINTTLINLSKVNNICCDG